MLAIIGFSVGMMQTTSGEDGGEGILASIGGSISIASGASVGEVEGILAEAFFFFFLSVLGFRL